MNECWLTPAQWLCRRHGDVARLPAGQGTRHSPASPTRAWPRSRSTASPQARGQLQLGRSVPRPRPASAIVPLPRGHNKLQGCTITPSSSQSRSEGRSSTTGGHRLCWAGFSELCRRSCTGFVSRAPPALQMRQLLWRRRLVSAGGA